MESTYLSLLTKHVLRATPQGLSKVKLAKILYFTHKGLVKKKLSRVEELAFIRMPLGPVPVGFKEVVDGDISVSTIHEEQLSYDRQLYSLKHDDFISSFNDAVSQEIESLVKGLNRITTSELVATSHKDPSWINHSNGEEYYLEESDLNIALPLPRTDRTIIDKELDSQHLQAKLMEGMLTDIVEESTSLEYPH